MSLRQGVARGAAWNLASTLGERCFGFAVLAILLRHVSVQDFGIIAIASAISEIGRTITTGGSGEQVVAAPGDRTVEAGAFWAQFLLALVMTALLFALAPVIARQYHAPALGWVMRALSFNIITGAFLIVPSARLAQRFGFRALSLMSLGSTMLGGIGALALVFSGYDLTALIAQRMIGIAFYAAAASIVARWHPPSFPRPGVIRAAMRFNLPMMGAAFVDYIATTGYVVLVGFRLPVIAVGQFRIAQRLAEVLQELAILPASKVFLPVFVAVRSNPERRFAVAHMLMDTLAVLSLAAAAIGGAVAGPAVLLMFGARWASAAPVFAAMSLIVPAAAVYAFVNPMLTALKRPGLVSGFAVLNAATIALAVWLAAPYGLEPLAWTLVARGLLSTLLLLPALSIGIGRPAWPLLRLFASPIVALIAARFAAAAALAAFAPAAAPATQLILAGTVAALTFLAVMLALAPARILSLANRLRGAFTRTPAMPETV